MNFTHAPHEIVTESNWSSSSPVYRNESDVKMIFSIRIGYEVVIKKDVASIKASDRESLRGYR